MLMNEKIKQLRKAKGLTQMDLAIAVGSTTTQISFWETGKFDPSVFSLIVLADYFNISLDELCCRDFKGDK